MASSNPGNNSSSLSRASSNGSIAGARAHNANEHSEEEDSDSKVSYKERRREAHTQAEQKRRDAIKKGYDYLQDLVPIANPGATGGAAQGTSQAAQKVSKAAVLQKSIEYIQLVQQQKTKQEEELVMLKKEVVALEIMRSNYEQLVKAHQAQQALLASGKEDASDQEQRKAYVPSDVKFQTFQLLMDKLFNSFDEQVAMNNFSELSRCVFSWLEEQCKPQMLQNVMVDALSEVQARYNESNGKTTDAKNEESGQS